MSSLISDAARYKSPYPRTAEDPLGEGRITSEADPNGIDPHAPGAKLDAGKTMMAQILGQFAHALEHVAQVGTFGARKYSLGSWLEVVDGVNRYENAQMRHWAKRHQGEDFDPDSGLMHRAHEAWNALAALEREIREAQQTPQNNQ